MAGRNAGRMTVGITAGVVLLGALGACGFAGTRNTDSDDTPVQGRISSVRVSSDSGAVRIRTGERAGVRRTVHYGREKPGATHHLDGDVLVIDSCPRRNCWIDYDITVPPGVRVDGAVDSGQFEAAGVAEVNLEIDSGDATIRQVSGMVNITAGSGAVHLADIAAAVTVRAESGDVSVDNAGAGVTVQADSGRITVSVPRGGYRVNTRSDSGDVESAVTVDPNGKPLDLHTDSGDIAVRYA
ncbi:MAG: DUF4097 family beta strand repeat-containing protein [Labedaea sp.]